MIYLVSNQTILSTDTSIKRVSVQDSLDILKNWDAVQFDTETTGLYPFANVDKLICFQLGNKKADIQFVIDANYVSPLVYKFILETKLLIGHNIKFDLEFLFNYGIVPRHVYDTMISEQTLYLGFPSVAISPKTYKAYDYDFPYKVLVNKKTLSEKYSISYALNALVNKYVNQYMDKSVRATIPKKGLTTDVIVYAANDVVYLEDIMNAQIEAAKKKECLKALQLENLFTLPNAYLEWCGIKLDRNKWNKKIQKDRERLEKAKEILDNWLIKQTFSRKSKIPVSVKGSKQMIPMVSRDTQGDLFSGYNLDYQCNVNWDSSKQVIYIAKILGFNTHVVSKTTGEETDSVLQKQLKSQKGINDEFLKIYFEFKEASRICSTYGNTYTNAICVKDGRIHTTFRAIGSKSGRMACGSNNGIESLANVNNLQTYECINPQLQNLPADEETRAAFVAEPGYLLADCDFSALESRLGADIYNEKSMIDEFLNGSGDMHSLCAKMVFKEQLKDVPTKEIKSKYPDLRKKVKPIELDCEDSL